MSDSRGKSGKPTSSGPAMPCGEGPGRWNTDSGSRPATTTTRIRRPDGPKTS
ncbi:MULTISPECIES: hypothetical protein [Streptomyces]|uniref:Uncharacterized protein n=1 Tax=Streptomyces clavifer TaxID=68188 RepID=A0ABS4V8C2_9ACTN|nr:MULTISPECIES: hypothetical protein [Streptomyces]MBP2360141.1 hypothetical protein [Streptomyces clavifer]MDX2743301.1 hypothetical protein [Streptomyces sp. NRRL_B-2557]GHA96950.1 hypothetical protein GCM10010392_24280 [Streptomyces clavifer]